MAQHGFTPGKDAVYMSAVRECHSSHAQHNDHEGASALLVMLRHPRQQHRAAIRRMNQHCRSVCLNAIEYAEQEAR